MSIGKFTRVDLPGPNTWINSALVKRVEPADPGEPAPVNIFLVDGDVITVSDTLGSVLNALGMNV